MGIVRRACCVWPVVLLTLWLWAALPPGRAAALPDVADWTAEGDEAYSHYGWSAGTAGDVNGDGYSDVIVGANWYDNDQTWEGRAFLYYGSASGLLAAPAWTAEGNQNYANFGYAVGTAGDVNGDGYSDVIVGAYQYSNGETSEGRATVYYGSASGLSLTADWTAEGNQANASFGIAVGTAGDVNGDGYGDVIVGAHRYSNGHTREGRAYVYYGSAAGLSTTAAWTAEGDQYLAGFGRAVGAAGDVNGDGYNDVVVGAQYYDNGQYDEGRAYLFHGSAAGLSTTANWTAEGDQRYAYFGYAVSTAGDVNGDGYADLAVGAYYYDNGEEDEGRAYVYYGSPGGLAATANWTGESNQASASYGWSVGVAGDVNGDGYADLVLGAPAYDGGQTDEGRAAVYYGGPNGLPAAFDWDYQSDQASAFLGRAVGTAGDVNGDGYSDVITGANYFDNDLTDEGRAFVFHGAVEGLSETADWSGEGEQDNAQYAYAAATAGDVNGDGYADVIVGAPYYDGDQTDEGQAAVYLGSPAGLLTTAGWIATGDQDGAAFGYAVGAAGDVNGDGYGDVIVGAKNYDNGQTDEGRVFVYYGSAAGLSSTANWTAESDQAFANFGQAVGVAGDVNGDGYGDVIVGAPNYDDDFVDEGRAGVFHGSAAGLAAAASWLADGEQASAYLGWSVSTAGDVNGDSYSDVTIGAPYFDNEQIDEGKVYVSHGSAAGLEATPSWTLEANQDGALLGWAVGAAGDVNGDGYSDLILGAKDSDNGHTDEGQAYVYNGGVNGLADSYSWIAESNQASANLGAAVGSAGDVNGDGYSEVVVAADHFDNGETDEGRTYLSYGAAAGLATIPAWTLQSDHAGAYFGHVVGAAGDVNGDGYADVLVGAYGYDNGQSDEGRLFVYYGNEGGGISYRPQQRRSDDLSPIAPLGLADSEASFRLALLGRTPFGRGRVKLEWEVKPYGAAFDGLGLQESAAWLDTGVAGVELNEVVNGLAALTAYHWRVRLRYDPAGLPFQPYGRWLTIPWNGWPEIDFRTPDVGITGLTAANDSPTPLGQTTTLTATVATGGNVGFTWDFGDGSAAGSGAVVTHTYPAGVYTATVTATNVGSRATAATQVVVEEPMGGLAAVTNAPTALGETTTLTATLDAGSGASYEWDFGDGSPPELGAVVTHTYSLGSYTAVVTASNLVSRATAEVSIVVEEPISGLVATNDSPTVLGNATRLQAQITAGTNVVFRWFFGDGQQGSKRVMNHVYPAAGTYVATVEASNAVSTVTTTTTVTITAQVIE
ncbi:MAG: FG-GAP-like repeat-containing protein [Chloroflexota bacterium]